MGLMGKGLYFTPDKKTAMKYTDTSPKNLKKMYGKKYIDEVIESKKDAMDKILYEVEASLADNEVLLVNTFKKQDKDIQQKLKSLVNDYNLTVDYNSKGLVSQVLKQLGDESSNILPMYGIKAIKKDFTSSPLKGKTLGGDIEYSIFDESILDIKKRIPLNQGNLVSQEDDPADTKIEGTNVTFNEMAGKVEQKTPEPVTQIPAGQEFTPVETVRPLDLIRENRGDAVADSLQRYGNKVAEIESNNMPSRVQLIKRDGKFVEDGPGRGKYQFEMFYAGGSGAAKTAINSTINLYKKYNQKVPEELYKLSLQEDIDFSKLPESLQDDIFYASAAQKEGFLLDDLASGKLSEKDAWLNYHWAGSDEERGKKAKEWEERFEEAIQRLTN